MRSMNKFRSKRWRGGLFLLVTGMLFFITASQALAEVNWTKYKGTTLEILHWMRPYLAVAKRYVHDFEAKTGMKVVFRVEGAWDVRTKVARELAAGIPSFDAWGFHPVQQQPWLHRGNHLVDQMKFINDPELTAADWDFDDFLPVGRKSNQIVIEDTPFAIALSGSPRAMFYRKDLFEKYGVAVPQTFEELEEASKKLTLDTDSDGKIDVYGLVMRGQGMQAVPNVAQFLYPYGGAWWTRDGKPAINKPESIRAIKEYSRMLGTYGPPAPAELGWLECATIFAQGRAAWAILSTEHTGTFENPEKSEVVGKVGFCLVPAGPAGRIVTTEMYSFGIPKAGKNPEAAWLFVQWLSSKEMQFRALMDGGEGVTRRSAWENPAYEPINEDVAKYTVRALEIGCEWAYNTCIAFREVREIWGSAIDVAVAGGSVEERANEAAKEIQAALQETNDNPAAYVDPGSLYMPVDVYRSR